MSARRKERTWKTSNTLRKLNASTLRGDVKATLRSLASGLKTLGSGNLYKYIDIPKEMYEDCYDALVEYEGYSPEDAKKQAQTDALNEWVAVKTVDFVNEVQMLYSLVAKHHRDNFEGAKQGFPEGYNYRFPGREVVNGWEYVQAVFSWVEDLLENSDVFPESAEDPFPSTFIDGYMRKVYTRLLRVYAIMYSRCVPSFKEIDAVKHLNTSWKHFYYFVSRYDLVDEKEYKALKQPSLKGVLVWGQLEAQYKKDKALALKDKS